jgi:hypothetical protein
MVLAVLFAAWLGECEGYPVPVADLGPKERPMSIEEVIMAHGSTADKLGLFGRGRNYLSGIGRFGA